MGNDHIAIRLNSAWRIKEYVIQIEWDRFNSSPKVEETEKIKLRLQQFVAS